MVKVTRSFKRALRQYQRSLTELQTAPPVQQIEQLLNVLRARDIIQNILNTSKFIPPSLLLQLREWDSILEQQKIKIVNCKDYTNLRNILAPPVSAWWWYFESSPRWWERLGWFWNSLTLIFLTISISLLIDAIPRFLSGGLDTLSVLAVIIPSLLALLTSGTLTPIGKEAQTYCFQKFNKSVWPIFSLILAFLLAIIFITINQFYFDNFAVYFNNQGLNFYQKHQLEQALSNYQKAVALNPSYAEAHYHLGLVYEDLQQLDKALTEYQLAVQQDQSDFALVRLKAYNNWGRILLIKKDYRQAIPPLLQGKNLLNEEKIKNNQDLQNSYYTLLKNLAWGQLELKNYNEAKSLLQEAINLDSEKAPAYCLSAQVLEAQKQQKQALTHWNKCNAYADISSPDEYLWLSIARSKIK